MKDAEEPLSVEEGSTRPSIPILRKLSRIGLELLMSTAFY